VIRDFNLLATTSRGNERDACAELQFLLEKIGDPSATIKRTSISGLIAAKTALGAFEVIDKFRQILHERPYEFRYMLRIIPIEKVVRTDLGEIEQAATEFSSKIGEKETFRLTVEKRFTSLSRKQVIETAAAKIHRKVNLDNPNKILLIEIVGGLTGVSVVRPEQILSILKEKVL
jgi:tRNA acetyltransferase TAN1